MWHIVTLGFTETIFLDLLFLSAFFMLFVKLYFHHNLFKLIIIIISVPKGNIVPNKTGSEYYFIGWQ